MRMYRLLVQVILISQFLVMVALLFISCGDIKTQEEQEIILVKIGDVTISSEEFMRRSEMTIRPAYCSGNNNIHKKIVLNSMIAEKMLALEAGEMNQLTESSQFQFYIQGRQEQAMREWLLHEEGYKKVK